MSTCEPKFSRIQTLNFFLRFGEGWREGLGGGGGSWGVWGGEGPKHPMVVVSSLLFALVFALSLTLFGVVILEIGGVLEQPVRWANFYWCMTCLVGMLVIVIPFTQFALVMNRPYVSFRLAYLFFSFFSCSFFS